MFIPPKVKNTRVPVFKGLFIVVLTVASIVVIGSAFYEYESSCEVVDKVYVCKERRAWRGASLPIISSFIGTALNIYLAFKSGKPIESKGDSIPPQE